MDFTIENLAIVQEWDDHPIASRFMADWYKPELKFHELQDGGRLVYKDNQYDYNRWYFFMSGGDKTALISLLNSGGEIIRQTRAFIADVLSGKITSTRKLKPDFLQHLKLYRYVVDMLRANPRTHIIDAIKDYRRNLQIKIERDRAEELIWSVLNQSNQRGNKNTVWEVSTKAKIIKELAREQNDLANRITEDYLRKHTDIDVADMGLDAAKQYAASGLMFIDRIKKDNIARPLNLIALNTDIPHGKLPSDKGMYSRWFVDTRKLIFRNDKSCR